MNRIRHIRRLAGVLAGLACAVLGAAAAAPAAFAMNVPGGGGPPPGSVPQPLPPVIPAPTRTVTLVTGGMPGWQIALIAIGAALLAATAAVLLDRARATHRNAVTAAT